jgi:hypothetical protein
LRLIPSTVSVNYFRNTGKTIAQFKNKNNYIGNKKNMAFSGGLR